MQRKKRILFAIGSMGGGGAERQTLHYLRHLDRSKYDPLLYLISPEGELFEEIPQDVPVTAFWQRHRFPRWNFPGLIHRRQIRDLANVMEQERIDALCAVTFYLSLVAVDAVQRRSTPWMAIEMADPRLDFPAQTHRLRWIKKKKLAAAYRSAGRCVAVSEGVRDGLVAMYGAPSQKLIVLPNFVDLDEVDRKALDKGPDWKIDDDFHIVSAGRLHPQKGHRDLLEAMADVIHRQGRTRIRLHLLGQGPSEQELRAMAHQFSLDDYVEFCGYVKNPLPSLRAADLFCLPSLFEGLPLALLEAMACRVPVLATDCPSGPAEVLADGKYGHLVPPSDPQALSAALGDAIENHAVWRNMAQNARKRVEDDYSISRGMSNLEQILDTVMSES